MIACNKPLIHSLVAGERVPFMKNWYVVVFHRSSSVASHCIMIVAIVINLERHCAGWKSKQQTHAI